MVGFNKKNILIFIKYSLIFSFGLFAGEYFIDEIFSFERANFRIELVESIFMGVLVGLLMTIFNKKKQ